jgi:hypothetical protein
VNAAEAWRDYEERAELTRHLSTVDDSLITAGWHMRAVEKLLASR